MIGTAKELVRGAKDSDFTTFVLSKQSSMPMCLHKAALTNCCLVP